MEDRNDHVVQEFVRYFNCYNKWKHHPTREAEKQLIKAIRALYNESRDQWRELRGYAADSRRINKTRFEAAGHKKRGPKQRTEDE
jgi:hypothetical protein